MPNSSTSHMLSSSIPLTIFIISFILQHGIYRGICAMFKRIDKIIIDNQRSVPSSSFMLSSDSISSSSSSSLSSSVPLAATNRYSSNTTSSAPVRSSVLLSFVPLAFLQSLHKLDPYARRRFGLYVLSTVHSFIVSIYSIQLIIKNGPLTISAAAKYLNTIFMHPDSFEVYYHPLPHCANYASAVMLLAYSLSYFIHDSLITLPEWFAHPSDALHHVFGIILVSTCILIPIPARLSHHLLITELSTPFLNIMWINKKLRYEENVWMRLCLGCFVCSFFLTRILYVPIVLYTVMTKLRTSLAYYYPQVPFVMLALSILNVYWFMKIVRMLYRQWFDTTKTELIPNRSSTEEGVTQNNGSTAHNEDIDGQRNELNRSSSVVPLTDSVADSRTATTSALSHSMNTLATGIVGGDIATSMDRYLDPNVTLPKKDDDEDNGPYRNRNNGGTNPSSSSEAERVPGSVTTTTTTNSKSNLRYRHNRGSVNDNTTYSSTFPTLTTTIDDEPVALSAKQSNTNTGTTTQITLPSSEFITALGSPLRHYRGTPAGNEE